MDDHDRLVLALGRKYTVAVQVKGKNYVLFIRELGLRHQSDDLACGHAELLEKKDVWIRDLAEEGLWDWIVPPGGTPEMGQAAPDLYKGLLPFFIKFACVVLLLLVVSAKLSDAGRSVGYNLEKKIDNMLVMPEDKLEAHRQRAHALAQKLKPIVQEFTILFSAAPEPKAALEDNASSASIVAPAAQQ